MPTLPLDAINLARQLADVAKEEDKTLVGAAEKTIEDRVDAAETHNLKLPMFLHEGELADALRVVTLLASGRNPFVSERLDRLRSDQQSEVLRALAVVVSAIASRHEPERSDSIDQARSETSEVIEPLVDQTDPASKRPLDLYLKRVEKQAILEALAETNYNQTEAARLLGITFRALRYRIENLGIET
jgi:DNA-binding NtrC family response regulator